MPHRRTPAQPRATRTVERILDAALALYVDDGVVETTTNAIALEANVSIGTIYQYFADKEAIAAAASDRCFSELETIFLATVVDRDDRPTSAMIGQYVGELVDYVRERPGLVALMSEGGRSYIGRIDTLVAWSEKPMAHVIFNNRPEVDWQEALRCARIIAASVRGSLLAELRRPSMTPDQFKAELTFLLLGYIERRTYALETERVDSTAERPTG